MRAEESARRRITLPAPVAILWLACVGGAMATPGAQPGAPPDAKAIAHEIEHYAIELAAKVHAPGLGVANRLDVADGAPNSGGSASISIELPLVLELVPPLCRFLATHPHLDFSRGSLSLASQTHKVALVTAKGRTLSVAALRLELGLPVVATPAHAQEALDRARAISVLRGVLSSDEEKFIRGDAWLVRDLRVEADGRFQMSALSPTNDRLLSGLRRLAGRDPAPGQSAPAPMGKLRVKRATREPLGDRIVTSFELEGQIGPTAAATPFPTLDALTAAFAFSDAWVKLDEATGQITRMESIRLEPLGEAVGVDFNMLGSLNVLPELPGLLVKSRLDASSGSFSASLEAREFQVVDRAGARHARARARISLDARYRSAATALPPEPPYARLINAYVQLAASAPSEFLEGHAPAYMEDLRIEGDGRVLSTVRVRDIAALLDAMNRLSGLPAAPIARLSPKRLMWQPFHGQVVPVAQLAGVLGQTPPAPGERDQLSKLESLESGLPGTRLKDVRLDRVVHSSSAAVELAASIELETTDAAIPALQAAVKKIDPAAAVETSPQASGALRAHVNLHLSGK